MNICLHLSAQHIRVPQCRTTKLMFVSASPALNLELTLVSSAICLQRNEAGSPYGQAETIEHVILSSLNETHVPCDNQMQLVDLAI